MDQRPTRSVIGKLPVALVCGGHTGDLGVITDLHAEFHPEDATEINVLGFARFEDPVMEHARSNVLPILHSLTEKLRLRKGRYEISLAGPAFASLVNRNVKIEDTSLSAAFFLTMLSARTRIPLPQDTIVTGHVSSTYGDLAPVSHIDLKIEATAQDSRLKKFIYPRLDDPSIKRINPRTFENLQTRIIEASPFLYIRAVDDISDLTNEVLNERDIVSGSLKTAYFAEDTVPVTLETPIDRILDQLTSHLPKRFWQYLHTLLGTQDIPAFTETFNEYLRLNLQEKTFPETLITKLESLLQSMPVSVQRQIEWSDETDHLLRAFNDLGISSIQERVRKFERITMESNRRPFTIHLPDDKGENRAQDLLDEMIEEVRQVEELPEIEDRFREAYRTFAYEEGPIDSEQAFESDIARFLVHINRVIGEDTVPLDGNALALEARNQVEAAYNRRGGWLSAFYDATHGTNGGLSEVLRAVADHLCHNAMERIRVQRLKGLLAVNDFETPVYIVKVLKEKYDGLLPMEIKEIPDEELAKSWTQLLLFLVRSSNQIGRSLRAGK